MSPARGDRLRHGVSALAIVQVLVLAALTLLLVLKATGSTKWHMEHDTPLLHYAAFLIDEQGLAPYRDIFETSMPGTFLFHYTVGSLFGYGDTAFRRVDLFLLACLGLSSFVFMRRFGPPVGWAAAILFPLVYLGKGNVMSLQRDYLGIVPLAFALCCIPARSGPVKLTRFAAAGALFGLSALVKPHLALGLPIFLGALLALRWRHQARDRRDVLTCAGTATAAFLAPLALALAWLWTHAALGAFFDIAFRYLPLHNAIAGTREILTGPDRLHYLFTRTIGLGGYGSLALLSLFAGYHVLSQAAHRHATAVSAAVVFLCAAAYLFYPTLAGKFWSYHYMPTVYFLTLAGATSLASWDHVPRRKARGWVATVTFLLVIQLQLDLPRYVRSTRTALSANYHPRPPKDGRVREIANWLGHRMEPGDTVQPLDWAGGGAVHAMLLARARPATRYLYDYHFYHHVSRPYIRKLRRSFLSDLKQARPRFVIESEVARPRIRGHDAANEFFELEAFLLNQYRQVRRGNGYALYERR